MTQDRRFSSFALILVGLFIAAGLALAGFFVSQTLYNAKVALNTAEARGLAERRVKADVANWDVVFGLAGQSRADIPGLYEQAEQQQAEIIALLKTNGFSDAEIVPGVIDYENYSYRNQNQVIVEEAHNLTGRISVETTDIEKIQPARASINQLIAKGFDIDNYAPSYHYTKLNDIKPDMLREATMNARIAANEFAENAEVEVGGIRSAYQGNFSIRDVGQEYGDTTRIEKDVRVVTTITFFLTD